MKSLLRADILQISFGKAFERTRYDEAVRGIDVAFVIDMFDIVHAVAYVIAPTFGNRSNLHVRIASMVDNILQMMVGSFI